ncbi:Exocyst complex, component Exoc1 domain-containing protein [Paramicrosporidium saccamoebae]|uniref:Exocyst complex, component Exoc1 domain-containing protein n=1 Tax=Paramicrosporidium saccamoebae TaxID=1246581 RepID=A0A2H9TIB9_9FUNG|nr:Exocyst complex, component Exoc1 domain-containing protein [Paramicrosporidium saccamoebae]
MESAEKSHLVLPGLLRAIDEVSQVDSLLAEYCQSLQLMGVEIQQIEELNRGLNIQNNNQQRLLDELDSILVDIFTNIDGLTGRLEDAEKVGEIAEAAMMVHSLREKYVEAKRVAKKIVLRLIGLDDLVPFLQAYSPLITALHRIDGRRHTEVVTSYQMEMSTIFRRETADLLEVLKNTRLIKRGPDEKNYLFVSLSASMVGDKMSSMGERLISMGQKTSGANVSSRKFSTLPLFDPNVLPELESGEGLLPDQIFHLMIMCIALVMDIQQSVCAQIFYEMREGEVESDERLLRMVDSMMMAAFASADEVLGSFIDYVTKLDNSISIDLLVVLDIRIQQLQTQLPIFAKMLTTLRRRLVSIAEVFIADQVAVIEAMKFSARKRSGIFPFVSLFPTFITRMEKVAGDTQGPTRELMNKGYERLTAAIFRSLDALAAEAERSADEKERINASVMNIQNSHYLVSQLDAIKSPAVETSLRLAQSRFDHHLSLYSSLSLHRFFSKLLEFFDGISAQLENTPPEEVAFHASYSKASAKRVLTAYPVREVRKNLELVWVRVEKHFGDDKTVRQVVWRAIQDYFVKDSTQFAEAIQKVYPGTDVQLCYSVADAMACFSEISH